MEWSVVTVMELWVGDGGGLVEWWSLEVEWNGGMEWNGGVVGGRGCEI